MDVYEALASRRSVRAFLPTPVPEEALRRILEAALRAPSGSNIQPWRVWVLRGAARRRLSEAVLAHRRAHPDRETPQYAYYPRKWREPYLARRRALGWALYRLVGIGRGDRAAMRAQHDRNFIFFDAPVGLFITVDGYLKRGSWADAGMYAQTIMLAARGLGLETCPQGAWIPYQAAIYKHLEIPEDQELVTGMSLGYADWDKIENTLVSEREAVENVAHWRGFD